MRQRMRVLERADTHDLTTVDTVRDELGLTEPDSTIDTRIAVLITQASSAISGYCDRVFGFERCEETFWPESWFEYIDTLVLDRRPLVMIESLVVDDVELGTDQFDVDEEKGIIYLVTEGVPRPWRCYGSVVITYTAGYELMDLLPEAIERACINMVQGLYYTQGRDPALRAEDVPGVYSYSMNSSGGGGGKQVAIPPEVAQLLDRYRNIL